MDSMTRFLDARRARTAAAWALNDEIVLIAAGEPIGIPGGADQTSPFLSHAEYFWHTDHEAVGAVLAFDPKSGWTDFVPVTTEDLAARFDQLVLEQAARLAK